MNPLLSVRDLTVGFGDRTVIRGLNSEVNAEMPWPLLARMAPVRQCCSRLCCS